MDSGLRSNREVETPFKSVHPTKISRLIALLDIKVGKTHFFFPLHIVGTKMDQEPSYWWILRSPSLKYTGPSVVQPPGEPDFSLPCVRRAWETMLSKEGFSQEKESCSGGKPNRCEVSLLWSISWGDSICVFLYLFRVCFEIYYFFNAHL